MSDQAIVRVNPEDMSRAQLSDALVLTTDQNAQLAQELRAKKKLHLGVKVGVGVGAAAGVGYADGRLGADGKLAAAAATALIGASALVGESSPVVANLAAEGGTAVLNGLAYKDANDRGKRDAADELARLEAQKAQRAAATSGG